MAQAVALPRILVTVAVTEQPDRLCGQSWANGHPACLSSHPLISAVPPTGGSQLKPESKAALRDSQPPGAQREVEKVRGGLEEGSENTQPSREMPTWSKQARGSAKVGGHELHRGPDNRKRDLFQRRRGSLGTTVHTSSMRVAFQLPLQLGLELGTRTEPSGALEKGIIP